MSLRRMLKGLFPSTLRQDRRRPGRPVVEELENRCLPSTFTVLNTNDSGAGSLRQAILDANATPGQDTIDFSIGSGVQTISPVLALPTITDPVIIDGTTQPGYAGSPLIELNGASAGTADGLTITAANSVVRGLAINRFGNGSGIVLSGSGATGNTIEADYIGTDPGGTTAEGNQFGVLVDHAANNTVGGATAAERNVISGNTLYGVFITGIFTGGATGNVVQGNYIGTDATGSQAVANGFFGINISDGSYNHVDGNVISGNGDLTLPYDAGPAGITVGQDIGISQYNTVTNNRIGVGADGVTPVPNLCGVEFGGGGQYNTFEGNLIAHNIWQGVQIGGDFLPQPTPTSYNVFRDNQITNNGGNGLEIAAGNGITYDWIYTQSFLSIPDRGAQQNTIQDNNISGNGGIGVLIDGVRGDDNFLYGNTIASNSGPGVQISGGAQGNQIGGTDPGQANLIHDNAGAGILFRTLGHDFNIFPGQDVYIANSPGSAAGPTIIPVSDNAVSGNAIFANSGPVIDAPADVAAANAVQGNFVGPDWALGTQTAITSSATATVHGQAVTFTAAVRAAFSSSGTPTGSVQFEIDGSPLGGPVVLQGGSASFSTMAVPVGTHSITAVYTSDSADLLGSATLAPLPLNVSPAQAVLFTADQQTVTVERGTVARVSVSITNTDSVPHDLTSLAVVDPLVDIPVHFETADSLPRTLAPGETMQATLVVDASNAVNSQVDVQGVLTSTGEPAQDAAFFNIVVVSPGTPAQPDLTLSLAASPAKPTAGTSVTIQATVRNVGGAASVASEVSFLVFDTATSANVEIGRVAVPALAAGGSTTVSFTWDTANSALPFPTVDGVVLLTVRVDPDNLIAEVREGNNTASQLLTVGSTPVVQGYVSVRGSVGLVCGADLPVSGVAEYDLPSGQTTLHFPVQGGIVTMQVLDAATGALLQEVTGYHTDSNGRYSVPISRPSADTLVRVTVSDTGFAGTCVLRLPVALIPAADSCVGLDGVPESPPTPPSPATPPGDIFVYSEDIQFVGSDHPAAGATTTILASIHLDGTVPAYDVPVEVNAIYADGNALRTVVIGRSVVSFPNGGEHGAALVSVDWTNPGDAPCIIQVVVEPPQGQFTGNDKATREITVGTPAATVQIDVGGAISTRCGGDISASLTAEYVIATGTESFTFPVQGGDFLVSRLNADTGTNIDQVSGHSNTSGTFDVLRTSLGEVNTIIRTDVTDTTLPYEQDLFSPACVSNPTPPAPKAPPTQTQDVYVFSSDVAFSVANPHLGQTITIFATIHYFGNPPALDVPVTVNDIFPVGDTLVTEEIGHTTVSFPDGGADGPAFVIINWTNHLEGAHIIQVDAEPSFAQYTGNDRATRLLFVGTMTGPSSNTAPLAQDDALATDEDAPLTFAAADLLGNDIDAELNPLTAAIATGPTHGTLEQNPDGSFTYTPSADFNGTDQFTYRSSDGNLDSNEATVTISVRPVIDPVAVVVVSSGSPSTYGQEVTFTAVVSAVSPTAGTPTGSVQFQVDGADYGLPVELAAGTASISTDILSAGPHEIMARYLSDQDDFEDGSTTAPWIQTVAQAPLTVKADALSRVYGQQNPDFTASYAGFVLGQGPGVLSGTLAFSTPATITSDVGMYAILPCGLTSSNYDVIFAPGILTVTPASTTTALGSSLNPATVGQTVTFTATVAASAPGSGTPSGTVTFYDGVTALGTGTLNGGQATLTTTVLSAGSHTIRAVYNGDGNFRTSTSATLSETVNPGTPGKITGGSSIDSGVRNFGFVVQAKNQNGALVYSGNIEFQDKAKGYNLHSTAITLIQVNPDGIHGTFQGIATVNGVAGYTFTVFVEDNAEPGAGVDKFRIQIAGPGGFNYDSSVYATRGGLLDRGGNVQVHKGAMSLVTEDGAGDPSSTSSVLLHSAGELLQGVLLVSVQEDGNMTPEEQARIDDALAMLNAELGSYGVDLEEVSGGDGAAADIHIHLASTSVIGGVADGVLGCETDAGDITIVTGWNWYTGSDASAVGADQYDLQTIVTHELGHALGLGHSSDSGSVMYATLASGVARRELTANDLQAIEVSAGGPEPLLAAPRAVDHQGEDGTRPEPAANRPPSTDPALPDSLLWAMDSGSREGSAGEVAIFPSARVAAVTRPAAAPDTLALDAALSRGGFGLGAWGREEPASDGWACDVQGGVARLDSFFTQLKEKHSL